MPDLCAVYEVSEVDPEVGTVNVESAPAGYPAPSGSLANVGAVHFDAASYGARLSGDNYPSGMPWRSGETGWGYVQPDGSFEAATKDTSDLVVTGSLQDGTPVADVHRNMPVTDLVYVDASGAMPLQTAALNLPASVQAKPVTQQVLTEGHTVAGISKSSTTRYGLPSALALAADRYAVQFDYGAGTYTHTSRLFSDLTLQPSPMVEISGFTAVQTGAGFVVGETQGTVTLDLRWDPYPDAVGYIVNVSIRTCCSGLGTYRTELTYFSAAALGRPGCKKSFSRSYNTYLREATTGNVRAVTSSLGPAVFPLGWPSSDVLVGITNGVRWN